MLELPGQGGLLATFTSIDSTYLDTNGDLQKAFLATGSLGAVYTIGLEHVVPRSLAKHLLRGRTLRLLTTSLASVYELYLSARTST